MQGEANGTSPYTAQAQTSASAGDAWSFLPPLQRKIIHFILDQPNRKEGIHVTTIARAVGGDAHEIRYVLALCQRVIELYICFYTVGPSIL